MMPRKSLLVSLLIATVFVGWRGAAWSTRLRAAWHTLRHAPAALDATVSQTYVLGDSWLTFPIEPRADIVRLLTNATLRRPLPTPDYSDVRQGWRYQLEYRLLDRDGGLLKQGTNHFRTKVVQYLAASENGPITQSYFEDRHVAPATTRRLRINLDRLTGVAAQLQVRLAAKDPEIEEIVSRMAAHVERPEYDDPDVWLRMSMRRKQRLCESAIYPPDLLTRRQRTDLLRWQWLPSAPLGVEGRNYERRVMFSRTLLDGLELDSNYAPAGLVLQPRVRTVVRLPAAAGRVTTSVQPCLPSAEKGGDAAGGDARHAVGGEVVLAWFDSQHQQQDLRRLPIVELTPADLESPVESSVELAVQGGWLELTTDRQAAVKLFWCDAESSDPPREFTPQPPIQLSYPCGPHELQFDIEHFADKPTPIRLMVRQVLADSDDQHGHGAVRWSLLDAAGVTLETGQVPIPEAAAQFDWAALPEPGAHISESQCLFWATPPAVKTLVVTAMDGRPLVSVATRPADRPRQAVVATASLGQDDEAASSPVQSWFALRPRSHRELVKNQQAVVLHLGAEPPDVSPEVLAGDFLWEDFQPLGEWTGRPLLLPWPREGEVRDEALASTFFEIPLGASQRIEVRSETGLPVDVVVAVARPQSNATGETTITLDGVVVAVIPGGGAQQEFVSVPAVSPGPHRLRIDGPDGVVAAANQVAELASLRYLKRLGVELGERTESFAIEKQSADEELLLLDYFFVDPVVGTTPLLLRAELRTDAPQPATLQPLAAWHPTSWEFQLARPESELPRGFVMGAKSQRVAVGRRCFLWLGENVPPGKHVLTLRVDAAGERPGYVVLSRVTPGVFPRRLIQRTP